MSIAVTTPTGNIGRIVVDRLLAAGESVTLLVRDPSKVVDFVARGATVQQGSLEDQEFVVRATKGASALFWLTPPNFAAPDFRAYQNRLGDNAAAAVSANKIERIVNLSSYGAHLAEGVGPVNGLHDVEAKLDAVAKNITHLRPGFFMENMLHNLQTIKDNGAIFAPIRGDARIPMIATKDIGEAAARCLLDRTWTGRRVVGLHGPRDFSFNDIAGAIGRATGRPVKFVPVTAEQALAGMTGSGLTADLAGLFVEMYQAFDSGLTLSGESRTPETTTTTTFDQFIDYAMKPALL